MNIMNIKRIRYEAVKILYFIGIISVQMLVVFLLNIIVIVDFVTFLIDLFDSLTNVFGHAFDVLSLP
jgi:hypothetical protein